FFVSSRRRHTRCYRDWSSDVCSSDLVSHIPFRQPLDHIPPERQTMLFSATIPPEVERLSKRYMRDPVMFSTASGISTVGEIRQSSEGRRVGNEGVVWWGLAEGAKRVS